MILELLKVSLLDKLMVSPTELGIDDKEDLQSPSVQRDCSACRSTKDYWECSGYPSIRTESEMMVLLVQKFPLLMM